MFLFRNQQNLQNNVSDRNLHWSTFMLLHFRVSFESSFIYSFESPFGSPSVDEIQMQVKGSVCRFKSKPYLAPSSGISIVWRVDSWRRQHAAPQLSSLQSLTRIRGRTKCPIEITHSLSYKSLHCVMRSKLHKH